jgi:hypothetical protein
LSRDPTHKCTICGAYWKLYKGCLNNYIYDDFWSLISPTCGDCCDNVDMGDQIIPITFSSALEHFCDNSRLPNFS